MNILKKKRNILIAVLISLILMVGVFLGAFFSLLPTNISADTVYNYGTFNPAGYYTTSDGAVFYAVKVKEVGVDGENYWPKYDVVVDENENPVFIKFGETVILKEDEAILLSFARKTESDSGDNIYIENDGQKVSAGVDFHSGAVRINGEEQGNIKVKSTPIGDSKFEAELGYIIDLNEKIEDELNLGFASGEENEGLIELFTEFKIAGNEKDFGFMFYAFKYETYYRKEEVNSNDRPEPALKADEGSDEYLLEYVVDPDTRTQYLSEAFYYYADQELPYLEFDYARYEVNLTKTIHDTTTNYKMDYGSLHGKNILAPHNPDPWTKKVYAQDLVVEHIDDTTRVKVYFSDLGVYDFSYSAVYYNDPTDSSKKVYLNTINEKFGTRKDRMTIYGTQATYQKIVGNSTEATPFRSGDLTADVTGLISEDIITKIKEEESITVDFDIASTNQPQVSLLFNSKIITSGGDEFKVYYTETLENAFADKSYDYAYTSNFTTPGYYYIEVSNQYDKYKIQSGDAVITENKEQTQKYFFQIKNKSPNLEIFALKDEGEVADESDRKEVRSNNYVKNGVQIFKAERASVFDSPTMITISHKEFLSNQTGQTVYLEDYDGAVEVIDGERIYYVITGNGEYTINLQYGRGNSSGFSFKIDDEDISGIKSYNVRSITGSNYYSYNELAQQGEFVTTNQAISLFWDEKDSGAKITASYVRFDLISNNYKETVDGDSDDVYKVNGTWLATDYGIKLHETKKDWYTQASSLSMITSSSVLSLNGLYIFKLEDTAGNTAFYSILIDNSIPNVLQAIPGEPYKKITGINNVSESVNVFFGSHKAIAFLLSGDDGYERVKEGENLDSLLEDDKDFTNYLKELLGDLGDLGASDYIVKDDSNHYFITVPITRVAFQTVNLKIEDLSDSVIQSGYHRLEPKLDADGDIMDYRYVYHIYDESNKTQEKTSRSYAVRVNTDKTGLEIVNETGKEEEYIVSVISEDEGIESINKYYRPTNTNKLYLTWENLHHEDTIGAYVDLDNNGLECLFYPLIWDGDEGTYKYSDSPTPIALDLDSITAEQKLNGQLEGNEVRLEINFAAGNIQGGKYEIIRTYTPSGEEFGDLGSDYVEMTITFYVDRNPIISAPQTNEEQYGKYAFLTLFDGGDGNNKQFYNTLYQQQSQSGGFFLQTNKLPIGIYIPTAKYGYFSNSNENNLNLENIQNEIKGGGKNYYFNNSVFITGVSTAAEGGSTTYSPFELSVVLASPSAVKNPENGIYYYYTYDNNGYFMLSGYSEGLDAQRRNVNEITDHKAFIEGNPKTGDVEYEVGTYVLSISAMQREDFSYLQVYNFNFNVSNMTPEAEFEAEYSSSLPNMQPKNILQHSDGNYYANTIEGDKITVSWQEPDDLYLTKVDTSKVQYKLYVNTALKETINVEEGDITSGGVGGRTKSFYINGITNDITKIEVILIYDVYSGDTSNNYKKFYAEDRYESKITIMIDKQAPTESITKLIAGDKTVQTLPQAQTRLRATLASNQLDRRFNKTINAGTYRYYSFMASKNFIYKLANSLENNDPNGTKYFYYRDFSNKYTTFSTIYETGLALDSSAQASNVFSEATVSSLTWTRIDEAVDEDYINTKFTEGYYEIVELDLAGNMTIYTIYITDGFQDLNIGLQQKLSANPTLSILEIEKSDEDGFEISASLKIGDSPSEEIEIENNSIQINSYDSFNFRNFHFNTYGFDFAGNTETNSYKYLKFSIDGENYLITPFCYTSIKEGGNTISAATSAIRLSDNQTVNLNNLILNKKANGDIYTVRVFDALNNEDYNIVINIIEKEDKLNYGNGLRKNVLGGTNIALVVQGGTSASLKFLPESLIVYKMTSGTIVKISKDMVLENDVTSPTTGITTYHRYIEYDDFFNFSTFYFAFKDSFDNEYVVPGEYNELAFDRYEYNGNDLTSNMIDAGNILVSNSIDLNFSNLDTVTISALVNGEDEINNAINPPYAYYNNTEKRYRNYKLMGVNSSQAGYTGGAITYIISRSSKIPSEIISELAGKDFNTLGGGDNQTEVIYVTIYNQLPEIMVTAKDGSDITKEVLKDKVMQSEPLTISFSGANYISEQNEISSKVFLRLRGSEEGYYQVTSPVTVSAPGVYDIYVQNFKQDGTPLDVREENSFSISSLNIIFYTVLKTDSEGERQIVSPTGKAFSYKSGVNTYYIPYHYIVNTDEFHIETRSGVSAVELKEKKIGNTEIWKISSTTGTFFETEIAITVVPSTNNILGENGFFWYYGTDLTSPSPENSINSTSTDLFLYKGSDYNEVSLRWKSTYNSPYNKTLCYISTDDGVNWHLADGTTSGDFTSITLKRSAVYLFKFVDYAGNTQIFTSASGYPSTTTRVTFIRSVIYNLNGGNPLDNSIYNGDVTISIPISTRTYYSGTPTLRVKWNNGEEYSMAPDRSGNYVFTRPGTYVVYFSTKVQGGSQDLNEDKLTFTIINESDSRWAFNYVNYKNYTINYIQYNGVNISNALRNQAISGNSAEINISAFLEDSLGNKYFNNGVYTIKITATDEALGSQSFEFNFWLNSAKPPISVSIREGESTTSSISVSFNTVNLYETLGECYVMINNEVIANIDATSTGVQSYSLNAVRPYYIQVYTDSDKLAYSYRVEISEPLNTITIILIVVSCVVAVGGVIIFILLRRKMKIR